MNRKILFVDDDKNLLNALTRNLRKKYDMVTAENGEIGLSLIKSTGPYAIVVSDLSMPGMNGIEFLKKVQDVAPDTIRIMLTGNADLGIAIDAVNEGQIFRFLTKPCRADTLSVVLDNALDQRRLVLAEKELLEKTLHGTIKMMAEILSMINPLAFSRTGRIATIVKHIVSKLELKATWQYEMAALLSEIGYITLEPGILQKVDAEMDLDEDEKLQFLTYRKIGKGLIEKIPRMELIADIIGTEIKLDINQHKKSTINDFTKVEIGAMVLNAAKDYEKLVAKNLNRNEILEKMSWNTDRYPRFILDTLVDMKLEEEGGKSLELTSEELSPGMVTLKPVFTKDGRLLANKGQEISQVMIMRIRSFEKTVGLKDTIHVLAR